MSIFKKRYPVTMYEKDGDKYKVTYSIFKKTNKGYYYIKNKNYIAFPRKEFRNYKEALRYLESYINSKVVLSNYEPTDVDIALNKLFSSRRFMEKLK